VKREEEIYNKNSNLSTTFSEFGRYKISADILKILIILSLLL
jgi:hypothetical protein